MSEHAHAGPCQQYVGVDHHQLVTHTRPEPLGRIAVAGYHNAGGTITTAGLLFASRCSWLHLLRQCAGLLGLAPERVLERSELAALHSGGDPNPLFESQP